MPETINYIDYIGKQHTKEFESGFAAVFKSWLTGPPEPLYGLVYGRNPWNTSQAGYLWMSDLIEMVACNPELAVRIGRADLQQALTFVEEYRDKQRESDVIWKMMNDKAEGLKRALGHLPSEPEESTPRSGILKRIRDWLPKHGCG